MKCVRYSRDILYSDFNKITSWYIVENGGKEKENVVTVENYNEACRFAIRRVFILITLPKSVIHMGGVPRHETPQLCSAL